MLRSVVGRPFSVRPGSSLVRPGARWTSVFSVSQLSPRRCPRCTRVYTRSASGGSGAPSSVAYAGRFFKPSGGRFIGPRLTTRTTSFEDALHRHPTHHGTHPTIQDEAYVECATSVPAVYEMGLSPWAPGPRISPDVSSPRIPYTKVQQQQAKGRRLNTTASAAPPKHASQSCRVVTGSGSLPLHLRGHLRQAELPVSVCSRTRPVSNHGGPG